MPAIMFDNGTVDIHHETNISGALYSPSFMEIENQHGERMYFNGIVIAGGGVYVDGSSDAGASQNFIYDATVIDNLATFANSGKAPEITKFMMGR